MHRRRFLKIAGSTGVIVAAAAAGVGGFVATRTPTKALRPWRTAGSQYSDPMRWALSYAILAPNPHNRQPWIVDLKGDTEAVLTCDTDRLLPETDPYSRQIVIGLGCFLELFSIAAAEIGHRAEITLFPQGAPGEALDQRPIARLLLVPDQGLAKDPLFRQALRRHTNRNPYDTGRKIADAAIQALPGANVGGGVVAAATDPDRVAALRQLTRRALRTELETPEAFMESVRLMRIGRAEIEASPDGIYLGGGFLEALSLIGVLTRETLAAPNTVAFRKGLDMADETAMSAMGFVWIATLANDRPAQIDAGRSYMRVALRATALGLAMQPMSQALQEYPAMRRYFDEVHRRLTGAAGRAHSDAGPPGLRRSRRTGPTLGAGHQDKEVGLMSDPVQDPFAVSVFQRNRDHRTVGAKPIGAQPAGWPEDAAVHRAQPPGPARWRMEPGAPGPPPSS